jgi:hypothetical protein
VCRRGDKARPSGVGSRRSPTDLVTFSFARTKREFRNIYRVLSGPDPFPVGWQAEALRRCGCGKDIDFKGKTDCVS